MKDIETYGDLKEAVRLWLNRNDKVTIDNIPMFINFAEKTFARLLDLPYYETTYKTTIGPAGKTIGIPTNFKKMKHLYINDGHLIRTDVETFKNIQRTKEANRPKWFTRIGPEIIIYPEPSEGDVVEMIYYRDIPEMVSDQDTPYYLTIAPDVMVYLSLRHAAIFLRDNEQEQYWMTKAKEAAESLMSLLDGVEWSGSSLVVQMFED